MGSFGQANFTETIDPRISTALALTLVVFIFVVAAVVSRDW